MHWLLYVNEVGFCLVTLSLVFLSPDNSCFVNWQLTSGLVVVKIELICSYLAHLEYEELPIRT